MSALRRLPHVEVGASAAAGLALGAGALAATTSHSQYVALGVIAEIGLFAALAIGNLRRLLVLVVVFDIPLQWAKDFGWDQAAANFGALGGLNISVTTLALTGLFILWAWERGQPASDAPRATWRRAVPLSVYVLIETVSIVVAQNKLLAFDEIALLGQTLLMFVYVVSHTRTRADVHLLVTALIASLLMESVLIIAIRVSGAHFHFAGVATHSDPAVAASDLRLGGTIGAPNTAAAFLCLLLPLAATMLVAPVSQSMRRMCGAALALGTIALVMTESRGGWISMSISLLVIGVVAVRRGVIPVRRAATVLAIIVLALIPLAGTISGRVSANDNGSAGSRLSLAAIAWHMIQDHPLLGLGVNNVALSVPSYAGPQFDGTFIYTVHDKYLLVWAEAGIFALLAFLWFLVSTVRRGWATARVGDPMFSPIALGLTAAILGQLVHMAVDLFQSRPQVQLLWLVAGLLTAMAALLERERRFARPDTHRMRA